MTQLAAYIATNGTDLTIKGRAFTVDGPIQDGNTALATFSTQRTSYTGVLCVNARVPGKPGAEVWSLVGGGKTQATFAIHEGALLALR
ncbi:hypothetical protein [Rhodanobacter denitrificans]|uniref:hypothetical protein n=1 Tax=Rhodanobacter denitrificans TaxID=666685 RepID=UPI001F4789E5|nr:hypothetical protein [Rhodanobacter denitrificans]UJJ60607.1 hypothetical protein LRK55_19425 [Rhodanobacter denitrificans]